MAAAFPDLVSQPGSEGYNSSSVYWSSQQSEVKPFCFVTPQNVDQTSEVVKKIVQLNMKFSVKGGGHSAFAGASNAEHGVTIDMSGMQEIEVAPDHTSVSVGAGSTWDQVSKILDPLKLAVAGGRASGVGVSGLILGGGISYFAEKYGMSCDNVREFEVVLSSGKIVTATKVNEPNLYWALRGGGGSNFGVVTKYVLEAFEQGDLWANNLIFPGVANATIIDTYSDYTLNQLPTDNEAHSYVVNTHIAQLGGYATLVSLFHSTPTEQIPPVFSSFQAIPGVLVNTTANQSVSALSAGIAEPAGARQTWFDTSIGVSDPELLKAIVPLWQTRVDELLAQDPAFTPFLTFQPFSKNLLAAMKKNGGNALGLNDEPFTLVQAVATWENAKIDDQVQQKFTELINLVGQMAEKKGLNKGWIYMNYAAKGQDVLKSYGAASYARLQSVATQYDPQRKLQKLWKGYFQL
mgnify:CR=1 FL=1